MTIRSQFIWIARFQDAAAATAAKRFITELLTAAETETAALFTAQNGIADASDVAAIYAKFGFRNDCGWQQDSPLRAEDDRIEWTLPEGMDAQDAEQLLAAAGAISIDRESFLEDEILRSVPHPAALFLSEIDELQELEDEDTLWGEGWEKKILH